MTKVPSIAIQPPWLALNRRRQSKAIGAACEDDAQRAIALRRREALDEARRERAYAAYVLGGRPYF